MSPPDREISTPRAIARSAGGRPDRVVAGMTREEKNRCVAGLQHEIA